MSPALLLAIVSAAATNALSGQTSTQRVRVEEDAGPSAKRDSALVDRVRTPSDDGGYDAARRLADGARGFRIVVSVDDRALWVLNDNDTLRTAQVGVASGETLTYAGRTWTFRTPRGRRTVIGSKADPVWTPPDWAYAKVASKFKLQLGWMSPGKPITLSDGRRLTVKDGAVGLLFPDGVFVALPRDEHIIFQSTLYVPPFGTRNRQVRGELGPYSLDLGNSYLMHGGSPSDGLAPTHGCIRLSDADLEWLYRNVAIGTPVYIY